MTHGWQAIRDHPSDKFVKLFFFCVTNEEAKKLERLCPAILSRQGAYPRVENLKFVLPGQAQDLLANIRLGYS
jgi:hypothetical protein